MKKKGFTLIEVLITAFVLGMVGLAVATAYAAAMKSVSYTKAKIAAVALANEKIEIMRNMPYDALATQHGAIVPQGTVLDDENTTRQGMPFYVHTDITYVDDPYDGLMPADLYNYDYKKIEVSVSKTQTSPVLARLGSNVAAKAAETTSNTGILYICVVDANNNPVVDADIKVVNMTVTPGVNITNLKTDNTGCVMIPKLPLDEHNHYHIEASKLGLSLDMTYPRTAQNPNALLPDQDVSLQDVTEVTLTIDVVSALKLSFVDQNGAPVANLPFTLQGSKLAYNNPDTPKYSKPFTAGADGKITIPELEFDDYKIIPGGGYYLVSTNPANPIRLLPNTTLDVSVTVTTSASNPELNNITPTSASAGTTVTITANGAKIENNATVLLFTIIDGNRVEIPGQNVDVRPKDQLVADFDLTSAAKKLWNMQITNPNGEYAVLINGFEVK